MRAADRVTSTEVTGDFELSSDLSSATSRCIQVRPGCLGVQVSEWGVLDL